MKPYTMTIAGKTGVSAGGNTTDTKTSEPAEAETVAAESVTEKESTEEKTSVTAQDNSNPETEPVNATTAAAVAEIDVPSENKGGNWTVVSVVIGVSAAATGIAILKIAKIL